MGTFNVIQVQDITKTTLEDARMRAVKFLIGLGNRVDLREQLALQGYTQADHLEGWRLLNRAGGADSVVAPPKRSAAAAAIRELDAWDELGFRKVHSALFRGFPEQVEFLFNGLSSTQGPEAILGVMTLLDRIDALEKGRSPATEAADKSAVATLATRGIDAAERARLRALIDTAQAEPQMLVPTGPNAGEVREEDLRALYAWYVQWSEIARVILKPRADQIALGIAKRRKGKGADASASPNVTTPPPAPASATPSAPAQPVMRVAANG